MKKIIHILNTKSYSGAENVAITIINATKEQYECVYASLEGPIAEFLEKNKIKYFPMKKINIAEMRRLKKRFKPDIIHAHDFTASVVASVVFRGVPIISHLHSNPTWAKKINLKTIIYYLSTFKICQILVVSSAIHEEFFFSKLISHKVKIILNPVDIVDIKGRVSQIVSGKEYDLIFLGRLVSEKNPIRFINIVDGVKQKDFQIKACIVGDGDLYLECKRLVKEKKLCDYIYFSGFLENPYDVLLRSKILCLTSIYEGFGLVAVEALALGVPVLATPVGGVKTIINPNCGKLCNTDEEFVNEIITFLNNKALYIEKSKGALQRAAELHNIDEYTKELISVYINICN